MSDSRAAMRLLVLLALLVSSGCSREENAGPVGAGGSSGGTDAIAAATGGRTASPPREPCAWEGWYRTPRLRSGCTGLCVPVDVQAQVPALEWMDRADWCPGCRHLRTPWASPGTGIDAVSGVRGHGAAPDAVIAGIVLPRGGMGAVFDGAGVPQAAWRTDYEHPCGRLFGLKFSHDGLLGVHLLQDVVDPQLFATVPVSDARVLMTSESDTFVWPAEFTRQRGINEMWFNREVEAADFSGSLGIAELGLGRTFEFDAKAVGLPGSFNNAQVVGRTVFASRFTPDFRTEWWIWDGAPRPFLGDSEKDVSFLLTDGTLLVWKQGTQPSLGDGGRTYQRHDLYWSPYATEAAALRPALLLADVPSSFGWAVLQNGYVTGIYTISEAPTRTGAITVRLRDGKAWRSVLPLGYSWNPALFPAETELWGPVTNGPALLRGETLARVPYAAMEVLQERTP